MTNVCTKCGRRLPLSEFVRDRHAAKAVSATLSTLAQVGTSAMLHMLSQVLEHPEVMV